MNSEELIAASPLRTLERMLTAELGAGSLAVTMARAGVGKTTFLVHVGLDALVRGQKVLHVAVGQSTEHVQAWYDALLRAAAAGCEDLAALLEAVTHRRVIQTFAPDMPVTPARLEQTVELFQRHIDFTPDVILIDGFDWEAAAPVRTAATLGAFISCAQRMGAVLWMSAQTYRAVVGGRPGGIVPPCAGYAELIDVALFLEPDGNQVSIRVLKDGNAPATTDTPVLLRCDTLDLTTRGFENGVQLPPGAYTLLSGGAQGAEATFGECAQQYGLQEMNFSFSGHSAVRTRGQVLLSPEELSLGDVSDAYLQATMHRTYPDTPLFRKVLQSIWHQVNTAGEVFVIGTIQDDDTVRGGTGWAAELARHWKKPLFVFDQERNGWFCWQDGQWREADTPTITRTRFTGTGTRFLSEQGRAAIRELFARSFSTGN